MEEGSAARAERRNPADNTVRVDSGKRAALENGAGVKFAGDIERLTVGRGTPRRVGQV